MLKVTVLCFENPYTLPKVGGKIATLSHIKSMLMCDLDLDLFVFNAQGESIKEETIGDIENDVSVFQYTMKLNVSDLFSLYPISSSRRFKQECVEDLKSRKYDVAFYEGEHMMKYRMKQTVNAKKHILYMHDIESEYRKELSKSERNPVRKIAQRTEALRFKWLESKIDELFDSVLFISRDERDRFVEKLNSPEKYVYVPIPVGKPIDSGVIGPKPPIILYVGDMQLNNNLLSVEWFVRNVFDKVLATIPEASLRLVGRVTEEKKKELETVSPRIRVLGYVDDIDSEFSNASFVACPVLFGAGVKIKTIDALARGQLVVGTSKAIEGTGLLPGKHAVISDNPEELARKCIDVLQNREEYSNIITSGLEFVRREHSLENQARLFINAFK